MVLFETGPVKQLLWKSRVCESNTVLPLYSGIIQIGAAEMAVEHSSRDSSSSPHLTNDWGQSQCWHTKSSDCTRISKIRIRISISASLESASLCWTTVEVVQHRDALELQCFCLSILNLHFCIVHKVERNVYEGAEDGER